jgi:hypothetical protein
MVCSLLLQLQDHSVFSEQLQAQHRRTLMPTEGDKEIQPDPSQREKWTEKWVIPFVVTQEKKNC